jgi:hypothetical protein
MIRKEGLEAKVAVVIRWLELFQMIGGTEYSPDVQYMIW